MKKDFLHSLAFALFFSAFCMVSSLWVPVNAQFAYPVIDTSGMHAYYDFQGSFRDSAGNNAAADPYKAELTRDRFSNPLSAVHLSDTDSYLRVEDHESLDFTDTLSISFWVYLDSLPDTETRIISKSDPAKPDSGSYWISVYPGEPVVYGTAWSFSFTDADNVVQTFRCEWGMLVGHWVLYTVTFDGSRLVLYLDSEPCAEFELSSKSIQPSDDPLWFGNSGGSGITGKMDDIILFERIIQAEELENMIQLPGFNSDYEHPVLECGMGDTIELVCNTVGYLLTYRFMKGSEVIQEGPDSICIITIDSKDDFGSYACKAFNELNSHTKYFDVNSCVLYDDIYIYDIPSPELYASVGDEVHISFYVNSNLEGLGYEMYHNGVLLPEVFRGICVIDSVSLADAGAYYFVVQNGCERLVSDTLTLVMEGQEYVDYEVVGWDWTGNIRGSGSSYFSSICTGEDGSFYLLGHYGGGLIVEDTEVFSSTVDDVFIVKYSEYGDYQWSRFLTGTHMKGKGDVAVDSEGNVYVSGSYWESIQIEDSTLITNNVAGSGYLVKYDPSGKFLWIRELETSRGVMCNNIEIDAADHIYLGGNFSGSLTIDTIEVSGTWDSYANVMFAARMDTAGSIEWISHAVTDPFMDLFGLIDMDLSASGQLVTAGTYTDMVDFGNGITLSTPVEAPFLVQFDEDGIAQWGSTISTEFGFAEAFDVSMDEHGRIFMTGMHLGDIGFGDFLIENKAMVMEEIFLARFDSAGVCTALNSYGSEGEGGDFGVSYEPASDTTGYLLGMFGDTLVMGIDTLLALPASGAGGISPNMFIAKLSDEGEPLVMKSAGVRGNQFFGEIEVTAGGRLYFAGLNQGVSLKKGSMAEPNSVAFVGFLEHGFLERVAPTQVVIDLYETICLGDSIQLGSMWYSETGIYTGVVSSYGIDSIFNLELIVEICTSSEEDLMSKAYMIYPNPANQVLIVNTSDQESFDLQMYGISGNLLVELQGQSQYRLDVQAYQSGLYILKLIRQGKSSVHKVLIE